MATDDERREIAKRLRESCIWTIAGKPVEGKKHIYRFIDMDDLARVLGEPEPSDESGCLDLKARLADLIEPGCDEGEKDFQPNVTCDREALLALAEEMDKWALTCDHYDRQVSPLDVTRYARRIREACGEAVA